MLKAILILLVLAIPVVARAQEPSQPPSPSGGKGESSKKQDAPSNDSKATTTNERGTDTLPLAVKLLNTGKSDAESAAEAKHVEDAAAQERWVGNWSVGLTFALVGATVLQFFALLYQGYWLRRSVSIAERALTELERPYVFWKEMKTDLPAYMSQHFSWDPKTTGPQFFLSVVNHGRTPANIDSAFVRFEIRDSMPPDPPKGFNVIASNAAPVGPGDTQGSSAEMIVGPNAPFEFPSLRCEHEFGQSERAKIWEDSPFSLYCYGWLVYRDIFAKQHETVFCRRWARRWNDFEPVGGRAKNYAK